MLRVGAAGGAAARTCGRAASWDPPDAPVRPRPRRGAGARRRPRGARVRSVPSVVTYRRGYRWASCGAAGRGAAGHAPTAGAVRAARAGRAAAGPTAGHRCRGNGGPPGGGPGRGQVGGHGGPAGPPSGVRRPLGRAGRHSGRSRAPLLSCCRPRAGAGPPGPAPSGPACRPPGRLLRRCPPARRPWSSLGPCWSAARRRRPGRRRRRPGRRAARRLRTRAARH